VVPDEPLLVEPPIPVLVLLSSRDVSLPLGFLGAFAMMNFSLSWIEKSSWEKRHTTSEWNERGPRAVLLPRTRQALCRWPAGMRPAL